ncbi:unnamed protein product [Spirodela intermedia]|uniref:Uncharacterized protein n=2 Tax=Spirodela intermedia TaxID=51605 RepID=A0A7I8I8J2_SPIIN|nr:unnamed protein product [Spirodela intermedia]CAA6653743.1 unnamed protein product [Spirodela intermedia]CAA7388103.1 unnamed protein product [Spirodela intermedia]
MRVEKYSRNKNEWRFIAINRTRLSEIREQKSI